MDVVTVELTCACSGVARVYVRDFEARITLPPATSSSRSVAYGSFGPRWWSAARHRVIVITVGGTRHTPGLRLASVENLSRLRPRVVIIVAARVTPAPASSVAHKSCSIRWRSDPPPPPRHRRPHHCDCARMRLARRHRRRGLGCMRLMARVGEFPSECVVVVIAGIVHQECT